MGLALASGVAGCGGSDGPGAKFGKIKAGEMPEGQAWPGVYYNEVYGYLHVVEQDGAVSGRWKRTDSSHWGELSGTSEGNLLRFTWKEHRVGGIGQSAESHGSGVFVYSMPADSKIPKLTGQYFLDDSKDIGKWDCVKQLNLKPDPNSINGDNPGELPAAQDSWK
jgi:hypothetical protein